MNIATASIPITSSCYPLSDSDNYLTGAELRAERLVVNWFDGATRVGLCYREAIIAHNIQKTVVNSVEDQFVLMAEVKGAIDHLKPLPRQFVYDHYQDHIPFLEVCSRARIHPLDWFGFRKNVLRTLARRLRL